MPELRIDPLSGLRVIVAGERGARPGAFIDAARRAPLVDPETDPFLEGHEDRTPPEVYALRPDGGPPDSPGWRVRVVPNMFPALAPGDGEDAGDPLAAGRGEPDLFAARPAAGAHEVVVNGPEPVASLLDLGPDGLADAMGVWRERMRFHAGRRLRARDRERGAGGRGVAAPHPRAGLRAAAGARPRWRASASASPPTATARRAATCSATWCRRRCAAASGWWRWTRRAWPSARSPRACPSTSRSCRARPAPRFEDDGPLCAALLHDVLAPAGGRARRRAAVQPLGAHRAARRRDVLLADRPAAPPGAPRGAGDGRRRAAVRARARGGRRAAARPRRRDPDRGRDRGGHGRRLRRRAPAGRARAQTRSPSGWCG